jgi:polysaccharide biosynthesis PFTS motif protein
VINLKKNLIVIFYKFYSVVNLKVTKINILDEAYEIGCEDGTLERIRKVIVDICEFENDSNKFIDQKINIQGQSILDLQDVNIYDSQLVTSYLLQLISFRRALLLAGFNDSKVIFPLKKSWQEILEKNNYLVSKTTCTLLWLSFRALYWFRSMFRILSLMKLQKNSKKKTFYSTKQNIYFNDLSEYNIPRKGMTSVPKTFISWLTRENKIEKKINIFHSNKKLKNENDIFENEYIYMNRASNLIPDVERMEVLRVFLELFLFWLKHPINRIKVILNIAEVAEACLVCANFSKIKIDLVIIHSSNPSLKPLWIIIMERSKVDVEYFFYAMYTETRHFSGNFPDDGLWRLAKWNKYNLIDEFQRVEVIQKTKYSKAEFRVVGSPWWADNSVQYVPPKEKHLVLFDSYSAEGSYGLNTLNEYKWNLDSTAISYLEDVLKVAAELDIKIVHKMKRPANNFTSKNYITKLNYLKEKYSHVYLFSIDIVAPDNVIEYSCGVICKPVSTIGAIAKELGKKATAYNPGIKIPEDDPALRGLRICQDINDLKDFMSTL